MTRLATIFGAFMTALGAFWLMMKNFARSQKALGKTLAREEQKAEILDDVASAKRIQDQIDKDLASLTPAEREYRLRDKWTRR